MNNYLLPVTVPLLFIGFTIAIFMIQEQIRYYNWLDFYRVEDPFLFSMIYMGKTSIPDGWPPKTSK